MVKKWALLVGCNYSDNPNVPERNRLHGCINDVKAMQALIHHRFGFKKENITILTDETKKQPTQKQPTRHNIIDALGDKVKATKAGDTLLFYFSGGGARVTAQGIPVIVPCDRKPIAGKDILEILEKRLPVGAFFTFICDSSYSGGLFDKNVQTESTVPDPGPEFHRKTIPSDRLEPVDVRPLPSISDKHIILLGSSKANQESVEVYLNGDESKAFSAFSGAIQAFFNSPKAVEPRASKTNSNVQEFIQPLFNILGFAQHPVHVYSPDNAAKKAFLSG